MLLQHTSLVEAQAATAARFSIHWNKLLWKMWSNDWCWKQRKPAPERL